jgi:hypothetical protein
MKALWKVEFGSDWPVTDLLKDSSGYFSGVLVSYIEFCLIMTGLLLPNTKGSIFGLRF